MAVPSKVTARISVHAKGIAGEWVTSSMHHDKKSAETLTYEINPVQFSLVRHLGYEKSAAWILLNRVDMDGSSKGRKPASRTYRITPIDQTSAMRPS